MMFHELRAAGYITIRLVNDSVPLDYAAKPMCEAYFSPTSVRKLGRRYKSKLVSAHPVTS